MLGPWGIHHPLGNRPFGPFISPHSLLMVFFNVVLILQEEVLVCAVGSEGDGRNAQTREQTFESVPSGERAGIAPSLAGELLAIRIQCMAGGRKINLLACPWIPLGEG